MAMMLPRGRATDAIALVTFLAFLIVTVTGQTDRVTLFASFIPVRVQFTNLMVFAIIPPWVPAWLTPLSATLVHGGWLHLALNLLTLIFCGRQVENLLGPMRLLIIYLVGAYAAALAQWLSGPASPAAMIGASGAISAVIGTYALIFSRRDVAAIGPFSAHAVRLLWLAAAWTGIQLLTGLAGMSFGPLGGIAIWAHVGGFLAGLLLARPLLTQRFRSRPPRVVN